MLPNRNNGKKACKHILIKKSSVYCPTMIPTVIFYTATCMGESTFCTITNSHKELSSCRAFAYAF